MSKSFGSKNSNGSWPVCAEVTITWSHCSIRRKQTAGGPKHSHDEGLREPSLGDVQIFSSGMWKGLFWTASVLLFVLRFFKKGATRSDGPPGGSRDSSFPWRADEHAWRLGVRRRVGGAPRLLQGLVGRREENESPSEEMGACCSGGVHERSREHMHSQAPLKTGRKPPRDQRGLHGACCNTERVTKLTETKPGNKYPHNATQG